MELSMLCALFFVLTRWIKCLSSQTSHHRIVCSHTQLKVGLLPVLLWKHDSYIIKLGLCEYVIELTQNYHPELQPGHSMELDGKATWRPLNFEYLWHTFNVHICIIRHMVLLIHPWNRQGHTSKNLSTVCPLFLMNSIVELMKWAISMGKK